MIMNSFEYLCPECGTVMNAHYTTAPYVRIYDYDELLEAIRWAHNRRVNFTVNTSPTWGWEFLYEDVDDVESSLCILKNYLQEMRDKEQSR